MLVLCLSPLDSGGTLSHRGWALRAMLSVRCLGMGTRQDPPGQGGCFWF